MKFLDLEKRPDVYRAKKLTMSFPDLKDLADRYHSLIGSSRDIEFVDQGVSMSNRDGREIGYRAGDLSFTVIIDNWGYCISNKYYVEKYSPDTDDYTAEIIGEQRLRHLFNLIEEDGEDGD